MQRFLGVRIGGYFPKGYVLVCGTMTAVTIAKFCQQNSDKDRKNFSWKSFSESVSVGYQWRMLHKNLHKMMQVNQFSRSTVTKGICKCIYLLLSGATSCKVIATLLKGYRPRPCLHWLPDKTGSQSSSLCRYQIETDSQSHAFFAVYRYMRQNNHVPSPR